MADTLLFTSLLAFILASAIMFLIPEKWLAKKFYNEAGLSEAAILKNSARKDIIETSFDKRFRFNPQHAFCEVRYSLIFYFILFLRIYSCLIASSSTKIL